MAGKKGSKVLLWLAAIVVVLILVAYAAVLILLPKDKIVSMIIPKIEKALNREVTVGDVSVSIWGGIGLRLTDLAVKNPEGFRADNLVELDHLDVKVKFFPLFKKRIEITKIDLNGLRVNLERTASGMTSFSDLGGSSEHGVERIEPEQAAAALPFSFDDLELENSAIFYDDDSSGFSVALEGISLSSTLLPLENKEVLRSNGDLAVENFSYSDVRNEYQFASLQLSISHDLIYDTANDSLKIEKLDFLLDKLKGSVEGTVVGLTEEAYLNIGFRTEDLKLEDVLKAIPRELLPQADDMTGSGKLHVVADYRGPAKLTRTADLEGKLTMKDIELAHEEFDGKLEMDLAELNFSAMNMTFFTGDAELAGDPLTLKIIVDNLPDPSLSAEVDVNLNLRAVKQFLDPGTELSGRLRAEATAYGKLNVPESITLLGSLELKDVEYYSDEMEQPLKNVNGEIEFLGKDASIQRLQAEMGESDFEITGRINHLAPNIFAAEKAARKPMFKGRIKSNFINLDELWAEEESTSGAAGTATVDSLEFPLPDIDAEGTFTIKSGIYSLVSFEDATGKFILTDFVLHVDSVTAEVYDGDVAGSAVVDIEDFERPTFQIDYTAKGIEINSFLSRFTSFQDHLFGEINMTGSFSGTGSELSDLLPTLAATGSYEMENGKLLNVDIVKKLAEPIGFKTFDEEKIRDMWGKFRVQEGRVFFDDLELAASSGDWRLSGSVGFDGSLDYQGQVSLSEKAAKNLDFLGDLKSLLKSGDGKVTLPFRLTGTYSSPSVAVDTSPIKENVDNKLKDEGKKLIDKLFKK